MAHGLPGSVPEGCIQSAAEGTHSHSFFCSSFESVAAFIFFVRSLTTHCSTHIHVYILWMV